MFVIGNGRIGGALAAWEAGDPRVLGRRDDWRALETSTGPIVVTTRNDDLDGVFDRIPGHRHGDAVLIQNGMLRPWLDARGVVDVTRGLLFFAVSQRGAAPQPGGESPFVGPHAAAMVTWLEGLELPARVVGEAAFREIELEKLVWNSAFGLLCDVFSSDVGTVVDAHAASFEALARELCLLGADALDIDPDIDAMIARLADYSRSIASYTGTVKEFQWRNGWFVTVAQRRQRLEGSVHATLLARRDAARVDGDPPA